MLLTSAGYKVTRQSFSYDTWIEDDPSTFAAPGLAGGLLELKGSRYVK